MYFLTILYFPPIYFAEEIQYRIDKELLFTCS